MSWSNASDGAIKDGERNTHAFDTAFSTRDRRRSTKSTSLQHNRLANGGHFVLLTLCDRKMGCPPLAIRTLIFAFPKVVSPTAFRDLPQKLRCLKNEITGVQR